MELKWYQTYDKNGVNSEKTLQYREGDEAEWDDVMFVREREPIEDDDFIED